MARATSAKTAAARVGAVEKAGNTGARHSMRASAPRTALTQHPPPHQARSFLRIVRHGAGPGAVYVLTYHRLDGANTVSKPLLAEGAQPLLDLLDQIGVDFRSAEVRGALEDILRL